jgi:membrane-associated phospholipid phosphatase
MSGSRAGSLCALLFALVGAPGVVRAEAGTETEVDPVPSRGRLEWEPSIRRLRPWEFVIGPALITAAFVAYLVPPEPSLDFAGDDRFDLWLQDRLSVRSSGVRRAADVLADIGFFGSMVYRGSEDLFVVGLARNGWPVASHFIAMDTMAFGLVGAVVWGSQTFIGRQRPSAYYCERDPAYAAEFGAQCERYGATRSFLSGHFASAVAGASLTCLYHGRFPIYRRPRAGPGACGTTIAFAVVTGISRSIGDGHWMTDILGGGALGFLAGWVLPRAVLFGFGDPDDDEAALSAGRASRVVVHLEPFADRASGGLRARGAF